MQAGSLRWSSSSSLLRSWSWLTFAWLGLLGGVVVFGGGAGCSLPEGSGLSDVGPRADDAGVLEDATTADADTNADGGGSDVDRGDATDDAGLDVDAAGGDTGVDGSVGSAAPKVILMIGDGMGRGHVAAASAFLAGRPHALFMESLPVHGDIVTASLSGLTDSAAAATTMATGVKTINGYVGMDREKRPLESITEVAKRLGLGSGVVSTASLPHATPGGFSAHYEDRHGYDAIARSQALDVRPDVMLGGGQQFYTQDLVDPLVQAGYRVMRTRDALLQLGSPSDRGLLGIFAPEHLPYVYDLARHPDPQIPELKEMSMAAIQFLERNERGFFLMIEGAEIDMASHNNGQPDPGSSQPGPWLGRAIDATLEFDRAIEAVATWAKTQENVTLIVTADHECGGLEVLKFNPAGVLPDVTWRKRQDGTSWGQHTNARVDVFAEGPGTEVFRDQIRDNTWIHAVMLARITGQPVVAPKPGLVVDGRLEDLRFRAADQIPVSGFGPGMNELDSLRLDADDDHLELGIEGLFEWNKNAFIVLLDVDLGTGTGPSELRGALNDRSNPDIDRILSSLTLLDPEIPGFGADFAIAVHGGTTVQAGDPHYQLSGPLTMGGLRGIRPPFGQPWDLAAYSMATNFGEDVRVFAATTPKRGEGWEAQIPWRTLYPDLGGRVPPGATLGIAVVLVNNDGGYTSNQALPPFPAATENAGRAGTALPGVIAFQVDSNGDGRPDDNAAPKLLP